jgi:hypothetical protein
MLFIGEKIQRKVNSKIGTPLEKFRTIDGNRECKHTSSVHFPRDYAITYSDHITGAVHVVVACEGTHLKFVRSVKV